MKREIYIMKREIINIVHQNSFQQHEDGNSGENEVYFATREHGDVLNNECSNIDYQDARQVAKILREKFSEKIIVDVDCVDEWVLLNVTLL